MKWCRGILFMCGLITAPHTILATYYDILQVSSTSSIAEIKSNHRKLALKYHPDKNSENLEAEECQNIFLSIQEAYDTLSNSEKRTQYDLSLEGIQYDILSNDNPEPLSSGHLFMFAKAPKFRFHLECDFGKSEIPILHVNLHVDIRHTLTGFRKTHLYYRRILCNACGGNGGLNGICEPCVHCNGSGQSTQYFSPDKHRHFQQVTKSMCVDCNGTGCKPSALCPQCGGRRTIMKEDSLEIFLPIGWKDGETGTMTGVGHMDVDGRVGDVSVIAHYLLPPGWVLGKSDNELDRATLYYNLTLPMETLLFGYNNTLACPLGELLPIQIDSGNSLMSLMSGVTVIGAVQFY